MASEPYSLERFPELDSSEAAWNQLRHRLKPVSLPAGHTVFHPGSACQHFIMVLAGSVKVTLTGASGREVVLYRVETGGTCILTTACLFSNELYPAEGHTETEVEALLMSPADFHRALAESDVFRRFVFSSLGHRFSDMMDRIETISFQPIETRLASALLRLMDDQQCIHMTHQTLATELGSAREVISRHLKRFESHQWIRQSRSNIELLDIAALRALAD